MMQITKTLSEGLKRGFEVIVPVQEVEKKLKTRLEEIGKKIKVPGFRPGKIPLSLLEQRYKTEALSDVVEKCVEQGVQQAVKDNNIKPAHNPKIELDSFEEGKDLTFKINMEVLPTLGDISLDNLSFERYVVKVPTEAVSHALENLAKRNRGTQPLQKTRKTQKGDIIFINFEGFIDEKPIEGGAGKNYALELGSGSFIPGFEDQLIGHEKGEQVKVKVTFPKNYHEDRYAGKPATFQVTISDIHEASPIKVDKELAEKLGFQSLEEMKDWVERGLSKEYTNQSFMNTKRHVLDALAERYTFEVPESMVEQEFESIWAQLCREIGAHKDTTEGANTQTKIDPELFKNATGKSEEDLRKDYKNIAERRVRLGVLLAEIGNRNNITVTNQELMNALMAKAREFPGREKEVFEFYRNNGSAMATLRAPIFENKVIEFILSQSKVIEKVITPEELEKILATEEEEAAKKISSSTKRRQSSSKEKDA